MLFLTHNIARQLPNLREKLRFLRGLSRSLLWRTSAHTNRHHTTKNPLGWEPKHTSELSRALPKIVSGGHSLPEICTFISTFQWLKKFSCGHIFLLLRMYSPNPLSWNLLRAWPSKWGRYSSVERMTACSFISSCFRVIPLFEDCMWSRLKDWASNEFTSQYQNFARVKQPHEGAVFLATLQLRKRFTAHTTTSHLTSHILFLFC